MGETLLQKLADYDVTWTSPSQDATGSMPTGNGEIGLNVWVEPDGDILILIARTDAWDENAINLKLGRVRLRILPNIPGQAATFTQRLRLQTADVEIDADGADGRVHLRIWVDAHRPVIRIESSGTPHRLQASLEIWRTADRPIKTQTGDLFRDLSGRDPYPTIVSPDDILQDAGARIIWCHHNRRRADDGYAINLRLQGLAAALDQMPHPLLGRTFGGLICGEGFSHAGPLTLQSDAARESHTLSIYTHTLHPATLDGWQRAIESIAEEGQRCDLRQARIAHEQWWRSFWERSWLFVDSADGSGALVTRAYVLQRFMNAAAGRGALPIKFNGSLFSVGRPEDPDWRRWGGPGFWFMNQRLIYWPMLAAGDWDLMRPWLRMYVEMLPLQRLRTRTYYGHGGAHYPETITFWGAEVSAHYGWTPFEQRTTPEAECAYLRYYWSGGIELSLILHEYWLHTQDEAFAREALLPVADAVTEFFDLHYPRDSDGTIRFEPAQALETWHEAVNPLPEIAGLRYLLPRLLALPEPLATSAQRARWSRMLQQLPPVPIGERDGRRILLPAERFDIRRNTENPELYAIFPYRLYGVGRPDLQLARDTFAARLHPASTCWSQDEIQMAHLGLAGAARDALIQRAADACHSDSRFPAFWNAHHDWIPDMDHGGVLQMALQSMLMQCDGRQIRLLPAWPNNWNATFRLHAPYQTTIEARVESGRIKDLQVTPPERRADIILSEGED